MVSDLRQLVDYWKGLSEEGRLPLKSRFNPTHVKKILPHIFILEVKEDNYLIRLAGPAFRDLYGLELTGKKLLDFYDGEVADHFRNALLKVKETPCIGILTRVATNNSGNLIYLKTIYLPCATKAGEVDYIIGQTLFSRSKLAYAEPVNTEPAQGLRMPHAWFLDAGFGLPDRREFGLGK